MKIKLMRLIKALAALSFTLPVIAAAQGDSPLIPDDQNNTATDLMNRQDNMLQGLLDSIWGGGTITEQTPNLLGTLSNGVASLLGTAIVLIMAYKLFMYTVRTGMAGESGGGQGPMRVSVFWSTLVPAIALFLVTPTGSSGYAPVQYVAYAAMSTGISIADGVALTGVKFFTGSNLSTDKNGSYIGSGGAASPINSADTDMLFNASLGANACRIAANKDLEEGGRHIVLRQDKIANDDNQAQIVFSYDLVPKGYVDPRPPLPKLAFNGFCGQIRLIQGGFNRAYATKVDLAVDDVFSGSGKQDVGLHETKFAEDSISVREFLDTIGPITDDYNKRHLMREGEKSSAELVALLKHSNKTLTDGIENGASGEQVKKWEAKVAFLTEEITRLTDLESKKATFLNGQTRAYTSAINRLNGRLTATATKLVGQYENIAVEGITFEDEIERRGIIVLGAQYWGVTQLSIRVREMARLDIEAPSATLMAKADGGLWGETRFENALDRDRLNKTVSDVFYSARPWNKNEILTAKGAGYKASSRAKDGSFQEYTNDQSKSSLNRVTAWLAGKTKDIIGSSDNLVVSTQNLGDWVGSIGWTLYILTGPMNPLSTDSNDSFLTRTIKTTSTLALAGGASVATAGTAAVPIGLFAGALAFMGEFFKMLAVPMMLLGAFMSYYIPAIPAVYFFMAMFGILIIFIEALIALPIWTVLLCLTSGEEGWETAHMRQGVILLLGLMARLTGTVMIFFAVIGLLETAAPLFVALLLDVYLSVFSTSTAGPLGWLFMVGGVAIFAYQIIIRSFSVMTSLMDMIMTAFNLGHQTFGDQGDEDKGRSLVIAQMGRLGQLGQLKPKTPKTPTPGE